MRSMPHCHLFPGNEVSVTLLIDEFIFEPVIKSYAEIQASNGNILIWTVPNAASGTRLSRVFRSIGIGRSTIIKNGKKVY